MAIGLNPKYTEDFSLNELSTTQFLVLASETLIRMNCKLSYMSIHGLIAYTDNGTWARNAEIRIQIAYGVATIQSASIGHEILDLGKNKKNVLQFIQLFEEEEQNAVQEELDIKFQELKSRQFFSEEDVLESAAIKPEPFPNFFSYFTPREGFFITPILVLLNLFIFLLMVLSGVHILSPENESLLIWGANFPPLTLDGQWWRLITNCFLHIGLFHLLMNMYALLYIGVLLEPHLGKLRFLTAYLLSGILASLASLWWNDFTISAGASGAIFGMYGLFFSLLSTNLIEKTIRKALLTSIGLFVGYNLLNGFQGNIDNAAHIGGLLSGLVIGFAFIPSLKKPEARSLKLATIGLLSFLLLILSFVLYIKMPNDLGIYNEKMEEFAAIEEKALAVYDHLLVGSKDQILIGLQERGIKNWEKSIQLIESTMELNLPDQIKSQNRQIIEYCQLRIHCYKLIYHSVLEENMLYQDEIKDYNAQIEAKLLEIKNAVK